MSNSTYSLKIKASLDTTQVQQALNNLKLPGGGGGGPGPGGGGGGKPDQEILNAARAVNLGKIVSGFRMFSSELEKLSRAMGDNKLVSGLGELGNSVANAITAFRAFGAPGAAIFVAMEALRMLADTVQKTVDSYNNAVEAQNAVARDRRNEKADERLSGMSEAELESALKRANQEVENRRDNVVSVSQAIQKFNATLASNPVMLARASDPTDSYGIKAAMDAANARLKDAQGGVRDAESYRDKIQAALNSKKKNNQENPGDTISGFFDSLRDWSEMSENEYSAFSDAIKDATDRLRGYQSRIEDGETLTDEENARVKELISTIEELTPRIQAYETKRDSDAADAQRNADREAEQARQEDERRRGKLESQSEFFDRLDFTKQLGVYANSDQLTEKQRASMLTRRSMYEEENKRLRQAADNGDVIDMAKYQENQRRIDAITNVLENKEDGRAELQDMGNRTDDWFHSIGGLVGGENIQENEYRLFEEITSMLRETKNDIGIMREAVQ